MRIKRNLFILLASVALVLVLSGCAAARLGGASESIAMDFDGGDTGFGGGDFAPEEPAAFDEEFYFEEEAMVESDDSIQRADNTAPSQGEAQQQIERLIIRTGSVSVTVDNTIESKEAIEDMVEGWSGDGAFVVNSNQYGGVDESPYIDISIRVPSEHFNEALDFVAGLAVEGTNPSINQSGQDVTEEYVDIQARLESLEAARERLLGLMENAATTEELLLAEQQLTQREAEIESLKGRLQYLEGSARLSSISISLQPYILSQPVDTRWRPAETIRQAFDSLIDSARSVGDFLIFFVVFCGPWLLIIIPVLYLLYRFIRNQINKRRDRRAMQVEEEEEEDFTP